jgi:hypothetical protein
MKEKVTMKAGQVMAVGLALNKLISTPLPVKTAYWISRTAKVLVEETKTLEEMRIKVLKEHCILNGENPATDENGNAKFETDEKRLAFQQAYMDLMNEDVDLELWTVSLDSLGDIEFNAADMAMLEFLIQDPEATKEGPKLEVVK